MSHPKNALRQLDVIAWINKLETDLPTHTWTIGGLHVWPVFRIKLIMDLFMRDAVAPGAGPARSGLELARRKLAGAARGLLADRARRAAGVGPVDAVFLSDGVSFTQLDGVWYERFCDPLIDRFAAHGHASLMLTPEDRYLVPRHSPSAFIQPRLDALKALTLVDERWGGPRPVHLPGYETLAGRLQDFAPGCSLPDQRWLARQAILIRRYADYFGRIFERRRPAIGFSVSYYGNVGMAFNLACREAAIPSVDIQHGLQGELHMAYGRWWNLPPTGYAFLPSLFWVWSEEEAAAIAAWNGSVAAWHRPIVGGNLFLEQWATLPGAARHAELVSTAQAKRGATYNVLFTLHGLESPEELGDLADVVRRSNPAWLWWLRCHPGRQEQRVTLEALLTRVGVDAEVERATTMPLYGLLGRMDAHVTSFSSTVLEAARLGVPSVVTHPLGRELFAGQLATGAAVAAEGPAAIVEAVGRQLSRGAAAAPVPPADTRPGFEEILAILKSRSFVV